MSVPRRLSTEAANGVSVWRRWTDTGGFHPTDSPIYELGDPQHSGSNEVQYGNIPDWVLPPPVSPTQGPSGDGPVRVVYFDSQTRIGPRGTESFIAYRIKALKPEGLAIGNLGMAWNPSGGDLTIHRVNIIRDNQATDVLKSIKFQVIQREGGLEQATLDGLLTATLQAPGLQVGDALEFAATVRHQDPTLPDRAFGVGQLPVIGQLGAFRMRLIWPAAPRMNWRATKDLMQLVPTTTGNQMELLYEVADPKSAVPTDSAPRRFNVRRQVEFSNYDSWAELSRQLWEPYEKAATLDDDSPLRREAAKIAATTADPSARALAALRLVQEQVRYVYVGLNGGNLRPASADETWNRRFGDCKGKTTLLLALLRELDVPAEAALVNAQDGDGIDERLPSPAVFDHVLVRATIGPKSYWLDGTRLGDSRLENLPPPFVRWALPLRASRADLVAVPFEAPRDPQVIAVVDIDASAGFDRPSQVKLQQVLRGEEAAEYRAHLASVLPEDADRALKAFWRQRASWIEPGTVAWRFDDKHAALILSVTGEGKPEWEGDDKSGRRLSIYGAGFFPPAELKRPKEQDQAAPWKTEFPRFRCWVTTIRLPSVAEQWTWGYRANPVDRKLGGVAYWRTADLRDNVMRTLMSSRHYLPEISAADAAEVNAAIPAFDNKMSVVYQVPADSQGAAPLKRLSPPFDDTTDWLESSALCAAPTPSGPPLP